MNFKDFDFVGELAEGLETMGFEMATEIQELAIPHILEGKDVLACAQTGTGKTAAFMLPALNNILRNKYKGLSTVVLVPTRELALQIDQQIQGFGYFLPVSSVSVYGGGEGSAWDIQKKAMTSGVNVVVATPGRLIAHMEMGYVDYSSLKCLVLDEADRMLDMGFQNDIMKIINAMPKENRQTLLFSATMPDRIKKLVHDVQNEPVQINLAPSKPAEKVLQAAYVVYEDVKTELLMSLLDGKDMKSIIVFASSKIKVNKLASSLKKLGLNVAAIHSDLDQKAREEVLLDFKNRKIQILVGTDIISRGIDIDNIELVINYDVPNDCEDYVHRVGRTARAKREGVAITFISEDNKEQVYFKKIEEFIEDEVFKIPLHPDMGEAPEYNPREQKKRKFYKRKPFRKSGGKSGQKGRNTKGGKPGNK